MFLEAEHFCLQLSCLEMVVQFFLHRRVVLVIIIGNLMRETDFSVVPTTFSICRVQLDAASVEKA